MISLPQDIRFALRQLRKSPGYALVAIITLALGIGANTAIFLLTYSVLLKSLPVPHPSQLIRYTFRKGESEIGLSYRQYQALQKQQSIATGLFAWSDAEAAIDAQRPVTEDSHRDDDWLCFPVLRLRPAIGRAFDPGAGEQGMRWHPEALLGYDYWRTAFHGGSHRHRPDRSASTIPRGLPSLAFSPAASTGVCSGTTPRRSSPPRLRSACSRIP